MESSTQIQEKDKKTSKQGKKKQNQPLHQGKCESSKEMVQ